MEESFSQDPLKSSIPSELDNLEDLSDLELFEFEDDRGFNLLLIAAEVGRLDDVNLLINRGLNVNYQVNGESAASLAFKNGHQNVVLALIKANSRIPANLVIDEASDELKSVIKISSNLHNTIKHEGEVIDDRKITKSSQIPFAYLRRKFKNKKIDPKITFSDDEKSHQADVLSEENLHRIFTENPSMRHFYDTNNNSLLRTVIITASFSLIELLFKNNIVLGPHEDMEDIKQKLTFQQQKELRDLFLKLSPNLFTDYMMTLMRNCRFGPDNQHHFAYMEFVNKAFAFLSENPQIAIILKIVAASRNFVLVFDFTNDNIQFLDPTAEPYCDGLFYPSGKIYIAAKDMLNPSRAVEICSVIAHELCHYAMFLVFNNMAKPYNDNDNEEIFAKICDKCEEMKESEEIVSSVFEAYPKEMHHAELIVRAPQMLTTYATDQDELEEKRRTFEELFEYYENFCIPQMEKALPEIEKKFRPKLEEKVKNYRKWIIFLITTLIAAIPIVALGAYFLYTPTYIWDELSPEQQVDFNNSTINFHGTDVKFGELFANNSNVYNLLSSENIRDTLNGDMKEFSKTIEATFNKFIYLTWSNMSENLRKKVLSSKVSFQGQPVKLDEIIRDNSTLKLLNSKDLREIITGNLINISSPIEIPVKFIVNRFLIEEQIKIKSEHYKNDKINTENSDVLNFDLVVQNVEKLQIFLLSNLAGEGKTTVMKYFSVQLKNKFPSKWIQFVDLKTFSKVYKRAASEKNDFSTVMELSSFLSKNLLNLNTFEGEIFVGLFESSNVIFLWDGVDEIAPLYKDFIIKLISKIRFLTKNFQFISTRPQYSRDLQESFHIKAHKLIPLGKSERFDMFLQFLALEGSNIGVKFEKSIKIEAIRRGKRIFDSIESSQSQDRLVTNPLLIEMIAQIVVDENFDGNSTLNFYSIFDIFIDKKLRIIHQKGEEVWKDVDKFIKSRTVHIMQVHQAFALITILSNYVEIYLKKFELKITDFNVLKTIRKVSGDEISRYGIVQAKSIDDFSFVHQTFAEYLVAQFFIDNMDEFDAKSGDTAVRLAVFNEILFTDKFEFVRKFLESYTEIENDLPEVFIEMKNEKLKCNNLTKNHEISNFFNFMHFSRFFKNKFSLNIAQLFTENVFVWTSIEFTEVIENWSKIENILGGEDFHYALTEKDNLGRTLLMKIINSPDERINIFLQKLKETLNTTEIITLLFQNDNLERGALMFLTWRRSERDLKDFWKFVENILSEQQQKELLLLRTSAFNSALHSSTWNRDENSFLFTSSLYEKFFTREEIQKMLLKINRDHLPFTDRATQFGSEETALKLGEFLLKIFEGENMKLREILSKRDILGHTIYSQNENITLIRHFEVLLQKTFLEYDFTSYTPYHNHLKEKYLLKDFKKKIENDVLELEWYNDDFKYFLASNNSQENMKKILKSINLSNNQTLLHDLMKNAFESEIHQFLNLIASTLNESEISTLISAQDSHNNTALIFAVQLQNVNIVEYFWKNFTEKLLTVENQKNLLTENLFSFAPLGKSFNFISKLYEKIFTKQKIQEILLKLGDEKYSFIANAIKFGSFENCQQLADFLRFNFKDEKVKLREILKFNQREEVFFDLPKENLIKNFKIFESLLRETFDNEDEFQKSSKNLKFSNLFSYLTTDFEGDQNTTNNFKSYMLSGNFNVILRYGWLNDFAFWTNESFEIFLFKIKKVLNKPEIFNFLTMRDEGRNTFMIFCHSKFSEIVQKTLNFVENIFNAEEIVKLLKIEDNFHWTALQYAVTVKDVKFNENVTNFYQKYLNDSEIREILTKVDDKKISFIHNILADSSVESCQMISDFLQKLFKNEKLMLRNFLSYRDKMGNSNFNSHSKTDNFDIFEKLFNSTFEENENPTKNFNLLKLPSFLLEFYNRTTIANRKELVSEELQQLLDNFDKFKNILGRNNFRDFLLSENARNETILYELITRSDPTEDSFRRIIKKLPSALNKNDIYPLLATRENKINGTVSMIAFYIKTEKDLRIYWNFIEEFLSVDEQKKLLAQVNHYHITGLQHATANPDPNSFLFAKQIYEKFFTLPQIVAQCTLFYEGKMSFLEQSILDASPETVRAVVNYFRDIFKDSKNLLLQLLNHRDSQNETIFSFYGKNEIFMEKVAIYETLLKFANEK